MRVRAHTYKNNNNLWNTEQLIQHSYHILKLRQSNGSAWNPYRLTEDKQTQEETVSKHERGGLQWKLAAQPTANLSHFRLPTNTMIQAGFGFQFTHDKANDRN